MPINQSSANRFGSANVLLLKVSFPQWYAEARQCSVF
jgi:hypothetical protein